MPSEMSTTPFANRPGRPPLWFSTKLGGKEGEWPTGNASGRRGGKRQGPLSAFSFSFLQRGRGEGVWGRREKVAEAKGERRGRVSCVYVGNEYVTQREAHLSTP
eukprot:Sspe_Gene.47324::Locus_24052_Transcript_1_1_Confidence_1.000_Length_372::g.47324::m.47324